MLNFFKQQYQFIILLVVWVICGSISQVLAFIVVPLSLLLLKQKDNYIELLIGFFFILIVSDSRNAMFNFAETAKSIYLVVLFLLFILNSRQFSTPNKFFITFIPFFIVAIFSLTNSFTPAKSIQKTLSYILLFVTVPAYINQCLTLNKELFLKYLVHFISFILLIGFVLVFITPHLALPTNRFAGIFGNPNGIGLFCSISFVLVTVIFQKNKKLFTAGQKKFVYGLIIASVLFSISRNSMFSILIFLLFQRLYNISNWLGFIILVLAILLYQLIAMNIVPIINAVGLGDFLRADSLESGSGRLVAWNFAWGYIQEHFVFGKGFAFDEFLFGVHQMSLQRLGHIGGVHNFYLAMWLNTGIIGLILYMYGFFNNFFKASKISRLAIPIMFSFLFSLTFEGWLMGSLNPYNIGFIFVLVILLHESKDEQAERNTIS